MPQQPYEAVVIGGSAGGLKALRRIISTLPATYPIPVIAALHIKAGSIVDFSSIFFYPSAPRTKEADEKEQLEPGTVYIAPAGYHLLIESDKTLSLSVEEKVNWARPSIDILFESAADVFGPRLIGIILTGANHDGAAGLKAVKDSGGLTIVQEPKSAEFSAMPQSALNATSVDRVMDLSQIGDFLTSLAPWLARE